MNQEEKARRYDWLLGQHKSIENQIARVPKIPLEETFQSMDSLEYTPQNQEVVNQSSPMNRAILQLKLLHIHYLDDDSSL